MFRVHRLDYSRTDAVAAAISKVGTDGTAHSSTEEMDGQHNHENIAKSREQGHPCGSKRLTDPRRMAEGKSQEGRDSAVPMFANST